MKNSILKVAAVSAILFTPACAVVGPNNSIELAARPLIKSVDGKIHMPQSEMSVDIHVSTAGANAGMAAAAVPGIGVLLAGVAGGAGAAVDAKVNAERQKTADVAITPVRDKLVGYDYSDVIHRKLTAELKNIDWLNVTDIELDRNTALAADILEANYAQSTADAYMSVNLDYAISADLNHITIDAATQIFPKTAELNAYKHTPEQKNKSLEKNTEIADTLFYRTFSVTVPFPEVADIDIAEKDAIQAKLTELDRGVLVATLEQAADLLSAKMAQAIRNPELDPVN